MQSVKIKINEAQYVPFIQFLETLNYVEIEKKKGNKKENPSIELGSYQIDEKPSDVAGLWKNDKRDLNDIRKQAWKQKR